MGGRGTNSFTTRQTGRWSGSLGGVVPDTLAEAIGTRGEPNSIAEAVVATNPHHSFSYREYSENCQRCVVAYELNRRGYDVTALPTYRGDTLNRVAYFNPSTGTFEGRWKGAFRNAKTENVGSATPGGVMSNIERRMRSYGDGSRAVVQVFYKSGGGHVFNVENQGGRVVYVEAQTGRMREAARTFGSVRTNQVNLVRTDNLRISERAKNFVIRR